MKDKLSILAITLASISIIFSAIALGGSLMQPQDDGQTAVNDQKTVQYVLYVGTNDKDTDEAKYTPEEARNIVDQICLKHMDGYTLQDATGSWTDENGGVTHEYTLVCYFDDADEDAVYAVAEEARKALNQSTILIERDELRTEYYTGQ